MLPANFRARTQASPDLPPLCYYSLNPPSDWGATHPAAHTRPDSPSRVPTPVLRASSIIFVQARELQSRDGGERTMGVTGWPRGGLEKRKMRFLPLSQLLLGVLSWDYKVLHQWRTKDNRPLRRMTNELTLIYICVCFANYMCENKLCNFRKL